MPGLGATFYLDNANYDVLQRRGVAGDVILEAANATPTGANYERRRVGLEVGPTSGFHSRVPTGTNTWANLHRLGQSKPA
jgi:hypothetical protein